MLTNARGVLAAATLTISALGSAQAATLVHSYDFSASSAGYVLDQTGSADGLLLGDAHVSGGVLALDGAGDAVQFDQQLIPFDQDFSVFLRVQIPEQTSYYAEIIAQGSSGAPGFYIGAAGSGYRLSDAHPSPGLTFHVDDDFHDLLLTNSAAGGFSFSIDGTEVYAASGVSFGGACDTRLGDQFCGAYGEWFKGQIDTLKVYSGVVSYADAVGGGSVPEPQGWALMILGAGLAGVALRRRRAIGAA